MVTGARNSLTLLAVFHLGSAVCQGGETTAPGSGVTTLPAIDRAFVRIYNFDFPGAEAILQEYSKLHPEDPLAYSVTAGVYLFDEMYRLQILQTEFFTDDRNMDAKLKLKPDPTLKLKLLRVLEEARKRTDARLAVDPEDTNALFAMCMAAGVETDYTAFVEGRRWRGLKMAHQANAYAVKLLSKKPPFYDAHHTVGTIEYIVGSLPFFLRWFIRFDRVEGDKQVGIARLNEVAEKGKYYRPYAKILLAVIYLREKQPQRAAKLLEELARDFPENPLVRKELEKLSAR
jgi:predicted Zn-dependent protease